MLLIMNKILLRKICRPLQFGKSPICSSFPMMVAPSTSNQPPFSPIQSSKPNKISAYLRLMRANKPIGTWLLYWPCIWSIALSAPAGCLPDLQLLALFGAGSFFMRSAGCIFNDLWDQEFDKKGRPLASGELTEKEATILLASLLSISLAILLQLNQLSIILGASSLWLVVAYPLAKRYTNWPQIVLGATFNWGALLGYTASTGHFSPQICLPLYFACISWTMVYDTIYAHQDKEDDILIGVGSTAIKFGEKTRIWLAAFSAGMIGNLALAGLAAEQQWPFYTALIASAGHFYWQIGTLKMDSAEDCWNKFYSNQWIGAAILTGIVLGNLLKKREIGEEEGKEMAEEEFDENWESRNLNINFYH